MSDSSSYDSPTALLRENKRRMLERVAAAGKDAQEQNPSDASNHNLEQALTRMVETQTAEREFLTELAVEVAAVRRNIESQKDPQGGASIALIGAINNFEALTEKFRELLASQNSIVAGALSEHVDSIRGLRADVVATKAAIGERDAALEKKLEQATAFDEHLAALRGALREALVGFQEAFRRRDEQYGKRLEELLQILQRENRASVQEMAEKLPSRIQESLRDPLKGSAQADLLGLRAELQRLMVELRQRSHDSNSLEPIHERTIELVDEARATARSVELVAQALHELQGELSQLRKSIVEPKGVSAELAEMVLEVQTQLANIARQLQEHDRKIEHAEVEIKSQLLEPKGWGTRLFAVVVTTLILLNLGATALLFLRP